MNVQDRLNIKLAHDHFNVCFEEYFKHVQENFLVNRKYCNVDRVKLDLKDVIHCYLQQSIQQQENQQCEDDDDDMMSMTMMTTANNNTKMIHVNFDYRNCDWLHEVLQSDTQMFDFTFGFTCDYDCLLSGGCDLAKLHEADSTLSDRMIHVPQILNQQQLFCNFLHKLVGG